MIYFIEIWNAKQAWLDLSTEERGNYMNQVGSQIQKLLDNGVKILTWSTNNEDTSHKQTMIILQYGLSQIKKVLTVFKHWWKEQVGTIILNKQT